MTSELHDWTSPGVYRVRENVHRIPLPLPGDGLRAVNVYALSAGADLILIDAGWAIDKAREQLEKGLGVLGYDLGSISGFLITHIHKDHYQLALRIRSLLGAKVSLGEHERESLNVLMRNSDNGYHPLALRLRSAGAPGLAHEFESRRLVDLQREESWEFPDAWLLNGQLIQVNRQSLRVVHTPGHTQGHVVFMDDAEGLLFSGDHILPRITPSIGFESAPVRSALGDYLASLALVRSLPDAIMLPAHGPTRPTTHDRIDYLVAHHARRLEITAKTVGAGAETAVEVAKSIPWTRRGTDFSDLDTFNQILAVNETAHHLDHLVETRSVELKVDEENVRYYFA